MPLKRSLKHVSKASEEAIERLVRKYIIKILKRVVRILEEEDEN